MKSRRSRPVARRHSNPASRRTFLAQVEALEPRHLLAGATLTVDDPVVVRAADSAITTTLHVSIDEPGDPEVDLTPIWLEVSGTATAFASSANDYMIVPYGPF